MTKSTPAEIRARFDNDVERFSSLETGQMTTQDAALVLDLIANTVQKTNPTATRLLDLGCGAGNFALKLSQHLPLTEVTLVDLSTPMLTRAAERLNKFVVQTHAHDIRDVALPTNHFDVVVAAAVLHHLRTEDEWLAVFTKICQSLRPGGTFWIWDLVEHEIPGLQQEMWHRYGEFLASLRGAEYRDHVFAYVQKEDSPRSIPFQLGMLTRAGFSTTDIIHKNGCFAALLAVKI